MSERITIDGESCVKLSNDDIERIKELLDRRKDHSEPVNDNDIDEILKIIDP